MNKITLSNIAGYATEKTVWQVVKYLLEKWQNGEITFIDPNMTEVTQDGFSTVQTLEIPLSETFTSPDSDCKTEAAFAWSLGALMFYLLLGKEVLEGKGGRIQTKDTLMPRVSSSHCSIEMSDIIYSCLSFSIEKRPSIKYLKDKVDLALSKIAKPIPQVNASYGKPYETALVKFWPEEMIATIVLAIFMLFPLNCFAQIQNDSEMKALVDRCITLRSKGKDSDIIKNFKKDTKWTLMDELEIDRNGECTIDDQVETFGLNNLAYELILNKEGITNSRGNFRNGQDTRYNYSLIEITVKKGAIVNYDITGREGDQLFAIIPYKSNSNFDASISMDGKNIGSIETIDGVKYIISNIKVKNSDKFKLTIKNNSQSNMSFVVLNHNSRN